MSPLETQALDKLLHALKTDSRTTALGEFALLQNLRIWLENRLKVVHYEKINQLDPNRIKSPVFIVGTPRSGTTFLYNLLYLDDENFRGPQLWELTDPVPPLGSRGRDVERTFRIVKNELGVMGFRLLAPNFAAVHTVSATMPEECMGFLSSSLLTYGFNTMSNVSSYNDWLMTQDQKPAMEFHKRYLSVMQHGDEINGNPSEVKRWLLKAPWHMNHLDALFATYPDARIINPHRDIRNMLSSLASLHARLYGMTSDHIDPLAIGAYQHKVWSAVVEKYLKARQIPENNKRILDLKFSTVHSNPLSVVRRTYEFLGLVLSPQAERKMKDWLASDVKLGKKGAAEKHRYESSWFGLGKDVVEKTPSFRAYEKKFNEYL